MYNGHGDVTNLLDGKGGIIGSYYYDAFGNVQENTSTFSNPYRYAGYQYDEEIGKYYLLNRMYDPESARFMQEDTYRGNANDPLSLNLYTYVNNNPMIYDDQNGHWPSFIDNFVSGAKNVASNVWGAVKETASSAWSAVKETASNIYSAASSAVSYVSSGISYAKDTVYNWGKQTANKVKSTYNTAKTVYNKVVKPIATNYAKQKIEEVKTGITVKAGEVADYVKGLDLNKLLYGDMPVVAETNVKYDYSPRTGGTIGDKVFNFWTSTPAFKVLNGLSEFQENNPEAMTVANAFMFYKGLKNPLAAEEKVQRSKSEIEEELGNAIKRATKAKYSSIRAYNGIDVEQIPLEYRADPRLVTEMEFRGKRVSGTNAAGWERNAAKHFDNLLDSNPEYWSESNVSRIENGTVPVVDEVFAEHFPQYKNQIGDKLIHHHIGGGGQAAAVPQSLHPGFGGRHNFERDFGIRGNDSLTEVGQTFTSPKEK